MIAEDALQHRAQIGGRAQIASLEALRACQPRPIGDDAAAHRAAEDERDAAAAVVGAERSVDGDLATELARRRRRPCGARRPRHRVRCATRASPASSWRRPLASAPLGLAWFACVSQPPISSTAACGPAGCARNSAARRASTTKAPGRGAVPAIAGSPSLRRRRRAARRGAAPARAAAPSRAQDRRRTCARAAPPDRQRGRATPKAPRCRPRRGRAARAERSCSSAMPFVAARRERAAEPARLQLVRPRRAALEHLLRVEVRALAIRRDRPRGRPSRRRARTIACSSTRFGWSANVASIGSAGAPNCASGPRARGEIGVADRRCGAEPVHAAAQDDEDEAVAAGSAAAGEGRGEARRRARRPRRGAARRWRRRGDRGASLRSALAPSRWMRWLHRGSVQRRWNSGASSSSASACGRVGGALELLRGLAAEQRPEASFGEPPRVDDAAGALGEARRPFDALPHRVGTEPILAAVAPAGGRRRGEDTLAERADAGGRIGDVGAFEHALAGGEQARRRDDEFLRRLQLGRRCAPRSVARDQVR